MDLQKARAQSRGLGTPLTIHRQRKEIQDLARAGIPIKSAEELLARMLAKVDELCVERDRLVREKKIKYPGTHKVINGPIERRFR